MSNIPYRCGVSTIPYRCGNCIRYTLKTIIEANHLSILVLWIFYCVKFQMPDNTYCLFPNWCQVSWKPSVNAFDCLSVPPGQSLFLLWRLVARLSSYCVFTPFGGFTPCYHYCLAYDHDDMFLVPFVSIMYF